MPENESLPERPQQSEERREAPPQKSVEELDAEAEERHERSDARDEVEHAEHAEEERQAEAALERELKLETFEEMRSALKGAAKEVFDRLADQFDDAEKMKVVDHFSAFTKLAQENNRALRRKGQPAPVVNVQRAINGCFQRTVDGFIDYVQRTKMPEPTSEAERAGRELNELTNRQFERQESGDDRAISGKLFALVEQDVLEQNKAGHRFATDSRQAAEARQARPRVTAAEEDHFHLVAERIAAINLFADFNALKRDGINIQLSSLDGKELRDPEAVAPDQRFRIAITPSDAMPVAVVRQTMRRSGAADLSFGQKLEFESDLADARRAIAAMRRELQKSKTRG